MKKIYSYFYFRSYDLLALTGNYDIPFGASNFLSAFIMLSIEVLLFHVGLLSMVKQMQIVVAIAFGVFLTMHAINYFLFLKGGRYRLIIEQFKGESKIKKYVGRTTTITLWIFLIYGIFTI